MTSTSSYNYHRNKIDFVNDNAVEGDSFQHKTRKIAKHKQEHVQMMMAMEKMYHF